MCGNSFLMGEEVADPDAEFKARLGELNAFRGSAWADLANYSLANKLYYFYSKDRDEAVKLRREAWYHCEDP